MLPRDSRRSRRNGRAQRGPCLNALETLERRELMVFTPLGASLPDLTASAFTSPVTSWGQAVTVTANVHNLSTSTSTEPLALAPGSISSADAPASQLGVYITRRPRFNTSALLIGAVSVPAVPQNSQVQVTGTLTMPFQPPGFPGDGGKVYIWVVPNYQRTFPESDLGNNVSNPSRALIQAPFPQLVASGLNVPNVMQPGDTIQPSIRISNLGPADTDLQGPLTVALVASLTPSFGPGSSIIAEYVVSNVPGISQTASRAFITSDLNLVPQDNIVTITGTPVTLPTTPGKYFIGVVIDPNHQIKQLQTIGRFRTPNNSFALSHRVGPPIRGLPPAGLGTSGVEVPNPVFPFPITGVPVGSNPNPSTTGSSGGTLGTISSGIQFDVVKGPAGISTHQVNNFATGATRNSSRP